MEPTSPGLDEFEGAIRDFAAAFGRTLSKEAKLQYFRVFSPLGKERLIQLFNWAVETLDSPLPSIARLRGRAVELGWLTGNLPSRVNGMGESDREARRLKRNEPWFVRVTCPKCEGEFMVRKTKLAQDAQADLVYECVNRLHWECPVTFRAADIQNQQLKDEV